MNDLHHRHPSTHPRHCWSLNYYRLKCLTTCCGVSQSPSSSLGWLTIVIRISYGLHLPISLLTVHKGQGEYGPVIYSLFQPHTGRPNNKLPIHRLSHFPSIYHCDEWSSRHPSTPTLGNTYIRRNLIITRTVIDQFSDLNVLIIATCVYTTMKQPSHMIVCYIIYPTHHPLRLRADNLFISRKGRYPIQWTTNGTKINPHVSLVYETICVGFVWIEHSANFPQ